MYLEGAEKGLDQRRHTGPGGMPSGLGVWDSLTHFITVLMPAMSNAMEDNLTIVGLVWVSQCGRLSFMRESEKYLLNPSAISTKEPMREVFSMVNLRIA